MSLPKQLIKSYTAISNCDLVVNRRVSEDNIKEFVLELNKSIPSKNNVLAFTVYKFNRNLYLADKVKFLNNIIGFQYYENMILWCDYKDILSYFKLDDKIFLGWDRYTNAYKAYEIKKKDDVDSNEQTNVTSTEAVTQTVDSMLEQMDQDELRLQKYKQDKLDMLKNLK